MKFKRETNGQWAKSEQRLLLKREVSIVKEGTQSLYVGLDSGDTGLHKYQNPKSYALKIRTLWACYSK